MAISQLFSAKVFRYPAASELLENPGFALDGHPRLDVSLDGPDRLSFHFEGVAGPRKGGRRRRRKWQRLLCSEIGSEDSAWEIPPPLV